MTNPSENLTDAMNRCSEAIRNLEQRLRVEPDPDVDALSDLRQSLDNARLTAWSVSELIGSHRTGRNRQTAFAFVAAERLRRLRQLLRTVCADVEAGNISVETAEMCSLRESLEELQQLVSQ